MKTLFRNIGLALSAGLIVYTRVAAGDELERLAAAIHYTPPSNFYQMLPSDRNDPGDDPLSMRGATLLRYGDKNSPCGEVSFSLGWAGVYPTEGKVLKFMPVGPKELKELLEFEYRNKFPKVVIPLPPFPCQILFWQGNGGKGMETLRVLLKPP